MRVLVLVLFVAACAEERSKPPEVEKPGVAPAPVKPQPVYTSAVCCVEGRSCALDEAQPLGTACACSSTDAEGHVC